MDGIKIPQGSLITIEYEKEKDEFIEFSTLVETIYNENEYLIMAPMLRGMPYLFKERDSFDVIFTIVTDDDQIDTYTFRAVPFERLRLQGMAYLKIRRTSPFKKKQRRGSFRLDYVREMVLKVVEGAEETQEIMVLSKDISAGGIRVIVPKYVKAQSQVKLYFDVGEEVLVLDGTVMKSDKVVDSIKNYDVRIKFDHKVKSNASKLTKFILKAQAAYLSKMARASDEERLSLEHIGHNYKEKRGKRDWMLQLIDLSIMANWFLMFVISVNFLLARPPWRFGIQKYWNSYGRTTWDIAIIMRNMYLFMAMLIVSILSLVLNSFRMKRQEDKYHFTSIISTVIAVIALLIYGVASRYLVQQ